MWSYVWTGAFRIIEKFDFDFEFDFDLVLSFGQN